MSDDGLRPVGDYQVMEGITAATEAPALFRRKGKIYLLGSGSTGWKPNPARMFVANQITGPYRVLGNPCVGVNPHNKLGEDKAFGGQSTFVMQAPWSADEWIAMFDIWNPEEPIKAGYIWLPLRFVNDNPVIRWHNDWKLGAALSQDEPLKGAPVKRDAHLIGSIKCAISKASRCVSRHHLQKMVVPFSCVLRREARLYFLALFAARSGIFPPVMWRIENTSSRLQAVH